MVSGLILTAAGILTDLAGQALNSLPWPPAPALSTLMVLAGFVTALFGAYRFVVGLVSPKARPIIAPPPAGGTVWPPAPAAPHGEEKEP